MIALLDTSESLEVCAADLGHLERAFGMLVKTSPERSYEVEQNGVIVLTVKKESNETD